MYNGINSIQSAKTLWHFMSLGATIGANAGIVGGTVYGLAKKADGWDLASCALTGYGVGMVAGAIIGAVSYGVGSYVTSTITYKEFAVVNANFSIIENLGPNTQLSQEYIELGYMLEELGPVTVPQHSLGAKIAVTAGGVVLAGGVTAGAGFGYHYLSKFILEDLPSILYGRKF